MYVKITFADDEEGLFCITLHENHKNTEDLENIFALNLNKQNRIITRLSCTMFLSF